MIRKIIHVDMDCFYAAIEERERPDLKGKPIVVGGDPFGRGVVATANYPARVFGIHSAMPSAQAKRLCPHAVFVRPHFKLYKEEGYAIREIFSRFTDLIEPLSLDEAYLDVSESRMCDGLASKMAHEIRRLIWKERRLTASAGVGPNKFIAKVASEFRKPNGLTVITPDRVEDFVAKLPIEAVPGIGKVTAARIRKLRIDSCGDMRALSQAEMIQHFGKWGTQLYEYVRGVDGRPVQSHRQRKSLSVENTYSRDLVTDEAIQDAADSLFRDLLFRLEKSGETRYKSLFVKVKFYDFEQTTLERKEHSQPELPVYLDMLREAWQRKSAPVRLLGLGVRLITQREETDQLPLFK